MTLADLQHFENSPAVKFDLGPGGFPRAKVSTKSSQAEVFLYGAQVNHFQKSGSVPLLFLSKASRFAPGKAIRGGIPICYPWFGPRTNEVAHGFARITPWDLVEVASHRNGSIQLKFRLPAKPDADLWANLTAEYTVAIGTDLILELTVTNPATRSSPIAFEACLHTYFHVGNVGQISITGLEKAPYLDHVQCEKPSVESAQPIRITGQTDRTYPNHQGTVEIHDPILKRRIRIQKSGSASTVVWNPGTTQPLADLAPGEHLQMVCVESGNVKEDQIQLAPGASRVLRVIISESQFD